MPSVLESSKRAAGIAYGHLWAFGRSVAALLDPMHRNIGTASPPFFVFGHIGNQPRR
jgi:hypothetical protein